MRLHQIDKNIFNEGWFFKSPEEKAARREKKKKEAVDRLINALDQFPGFLEDIKYNQVEDANGKWGSITHAYEMLEITLTYDDLSWDEYIPSINKIARAISSKIPSALYLASDEDKVHAMQMFMHDKDFIIDHAKKYQTLVAKMIRDLNKNTEPVKQQSRGPREAIRSIIQYVENDDWFETGGAFNAVHSSIMSTVSSAYKSELTSIAKEIKKLMGFFTGAWSGSNTPGLQRKMAPRKNEILRFLKQYDSVLQQAASPTKKSEPVKQQSAQAKPKPQQPAQAKPKSEPVKQQPKPASGGRFAFKPLGR